MKNRKRSFLIKLKKIIMSVIILLLCSTTLVGCVGGYSGAGSSSGGTSSGGSGSTGGNTGGSGSGGSDNDDIEDEFTYDSYLGTIVEYATTNDEKVFYDKYQDKNMSFNEIVDRQFTTLATYLYNCLNRYYIDGQSAGSGYNIDDLYGNTIVVGYLDAIDDNAQKTIIDDPFNYDINYTGANASWKDGGNFNISNLKNALAYIYKNPQYVANVNDEQYFQDSILKTLYSSISLTDTYIANFDMNNQFEFTGFSKEYAWNVLYFLSYSIIGEENINLSINNHNSVIDVNGNIITSASQTTKDKYKGYNVILPELVFKAFNACITESREIDYLDYWSNTGWNRTLYPKVSNSKFMFFSNSGGFLNDESNTTPQKIKKIYYLPEIKDGEEQYNEVLFFNITVGDESKECLLEIKYNIHTNNNVYTYEFSKTNDESGEIESDKINVRVENEGEYNFEYLELSYDAVDKPENYKISHSLELLDGETLNVNDSFKIVTDENGDKSGVINVYNRFIDINVSSGNLSYKTKLKNNYFSLDLIYYNLENNLLTEIPELYFNSLDLWVLGDIEF